MRIKNKILVLVIAIEVVALIKMMQPIYAR